MLRCPLVISLFSMRTRSAVSNQKSFSQIIMVFPLPAENSDPSLPLENLFEEQSDTERWFRVRG